MRLQKILFITALTGCMSCQQIMDSFNDTFHGTPKTVDKDNNTISRTSHHQKDLLANGALLSDAQASLRNLPAFAGKKEIYIYESVDFYDNGRVNIKLQNPDNPKYIDSYSFEDEKWEGPEPVQLSIHDEITPRLLKLSDINFASAAAVYTNYKIKADSIPGAEPTNYVYAIISEGSFIWHPQVISGSRERFYISFTKEGAVAEFYQQ